MTTAEMDAATVHFFGAIWVIGGLLILLAITFLIIHIGRYQKSLRNYDAYVASLVGCPFCFTAIDPRCIVCPHCANHVAHYLGPRRGGV